MRTSTTLARRRPAAVAAGLVGVTLASALGVGALVAPSAVANPGTGTEPGGSVGLGDVYITSASTVAEGSKLSFAGEGFVKGGSTAAPAMQVLSLKLDAGGPTALYTGTAANGSGVVGTYQVQADGTVSGSLVIPADIDEAAVNPVSYDGPHFLRFLGSNPAASRWSPDFEVDNAAVAAPSVTATAATTSNRGALRVTVTVNGTGFEPSSTVTVTEGLDTTPLGTIVADGSGAIVNKTLQLSGGVLPSGERQLIFSDSADEDNPGVTQVQVQPLPSFANLALDSDGTVTVANLAEGSVISSVKLDPTDAVGDETEILAAPITATSGAVATGAVHVPNSVSYLGTRNFLVQQTYPYPATFTVSAKVSPSSAVSGEAGYARVETPDGVIEQGLYQSAFSAASDALFVAAANVTSTSRIYKLDPDTLAVEASVQPAYVSGDSGALWAAYGIGVDDTNGTVWVTNTRQNTVAVYAQSDLHLLRQHDSTTGMVSHSRDVVADPKHGLVFVTSASEGSTGDGYIGVFEADDKDNDGTKYEWIQNIANYPRTTFSPMSLELDAVGDKLFTTSMTTQKAMVIDTVTLEDTIIDLPDLATGGRGASGVAYDSVTNRLFIASQNSDELMVAQLNDDMTAGTTVKEIATGAGALNVAFDPVHRLAYVANFGGTTITVVDPDGNKVANLPFSRVNHLAEDGQGSVYAVNKDASNRVIKLTPKVAAGTPAVSGTPQVGVPLTVAPGTWTAGSALSYVWKRGGVAIDGATTATYTPVAADLGVSLTAVVTGAASGFADNTATVTTAAVVAGVLATGTPTITGSARVGSPLTATPGTWTDGATLSYQWRRAGAPIAGATKASYVAVAADAGKRLSVVVSGALPGYSAAGIASTDTAVVAKGVLSGAKPRIIGTAKVGKKLTAKPGAWTAGVKLSYVWKANGKVIKGAKAPSLKLAKALRGKRLTVTVTGTKAGYVTKSVTSAKTKAVKK